MLKKTVSGLLVLSLMVLTIMANVLGNVNLDSNATIVKTSLQLDNVAMGQINGEGWFSCGLAIAAVGIGAVAYVKAIFFSGGSLAGASYGLTTAAIAFLEGACAN